MFAVPSRRFGVVLLASRDRADFGPILDHVMHELANLPRRQSSSNTDAAAERLSVVGDYEGRDIIGQKVRVTVREEDGVLRESTDGRDIGIRLVREGKDFYGSFVGTRRLGSRAFMRDSSGRVTAMDVNYRHLRRVQPR